MSRGQKIGKYRSKLEQRVDKQLTDLGLNYEYEPPDKKIRYTIPASGGLYLPDFILTQPDGSRIYIEAKGIWDFKDRYKHLLIRQQYPDIDLRFVFQRAGQRIRKGSKTTYGDICDGNGRGLFKGVTWKYSTNGTIPTEWFNNN